MKHLFSLFLIPFLTLVLVHCSDDPPPIAPEPEDTGASVNIVVLDITDSTEIEGANIQLYNADNNEPITRGSVDSIGEWFYRSDAGNFFVNISAQGYAELPPEYSVPIPFSTVVSDTITVEYYLTPVVNSQNLGYLSGRIRKDNADSGLALSGVLIIAENAASGERTDVVSGTDGYYVVYNLIAGNYNLFAYHSGYMQTDTPTVVVSAGQGTGSANLIANLITGTVLSGKITFLASNNSIIDISLLDSATFTSVPGLRTSNETNLDYALDGIPPGRYLAWASFMNDGYVIDPDWIFKNGLPVIDIADSTDTLSLDFSVTGAIELDSPTNPDSVIVPVLADSIVPTFSWFAYSSAKEYILEVRDVNGNVIWGGYNRADSSVNHQQVLQASSSVLFDFDGSATAALVPGETYQWKIYADKDDAAGVQQLISASEDLLGLFTVPALTDTGTTE